MEEESIVRVRQDRPTKEILVSHLQFSLLFFFVRSKPTTTTLDRERKNRAMDAWRRLWPFLLLLVGVVDIAIVDCWATIPGTGSSSSSSRRSAALPHPLVSSLAGEVDTTTDNDLSESKSSPLAKNSWPNEQQQQRQQQTKEQSVVVVLEDTFVTPERDPRSYRLIRLPNNLIALLVSDGLKEGVGVEAASVHVKAGHFDDTVPGLARTYR
jgi:hypothetical protein